MEQWKFYKRTVHPKRGEKIYEVSNLGRVRINGVITEPKLHSPRPGRQSYYWIGGFPLHRAIAIVFIPNPENKPQVDHINTITTDNRAENLRWVTAKENAYNELTRKHIQERSANTEFRKKMSESKKGTHRVYLNSEKTKWKMER